MASTVGHVFEAAPERWALQGHSTFSIDLPTASAHRFFPFRSIMWLPTTTNKYCCRLSAEGRIFLIFGKCSWNGCSSGSLFIGRGGEFINQVAHCYSRFNQREFCNFFKKSRGNFLVQVFNRARGGSFSKAQLIVAPRRGSFQLVQGDG